MAELYGFPRGRTEGDFEWPGAQIGISNIITRSRSETPLRPIDDEPGAFDGLTASVREAMAGRNLFIHDVVIHGVRVRAHTDSHHLADFWRQNWYSVEEWRGITGSPGSDLPRVNAYAFVGLEARPEGAYVSWKRRAVFVVNSSCYGQLKSAVLAAVGRTLGEEQGIQMFRGGAVERNRRAVLVIGPEGSGKSTCAAGLLELERTRLISDDGIFVRICYPRQGGEMVSPVGAANLEAKRGGSAPVEVQSLSNERFEIRMSDLDLDRPRAYAFSSEKSMYTSTGLVESFPRLAQGLLGARFENVPDVTPELMARESANLDRRADASLRTLSRETLRTLTLRMYAFAGSRAMIDPRSLYGKARVVSNPVEPVEISAILSLVREPGEQEVLRSLRPEDGGELALLQRCARAYEVNTLLQPRDVLMKLLVKTLDGLPANARIPVDSVERFLA